MIDGINKYDKLSEPINLWLLSDKFYMLLCTCLNFLVFNWFPKLIETNSIDCLQIISDPGASVRQ